jgi:hypothetical protein
VHGQSGLIYNLLTFPRMNLNALFKRIDATQGRRPHQLRAARAFGVSAYKAMQAMAASADGSFAGIDAGALEHFHLSVKATTAWAHPGNYLGAIGMLVNGHRLLVEAGPWETGFTRVELNGEPLPIGAVVPLVSTVQPKRPAGGLDASASASANSSGSGSAKPRLTALATAEAAAQFATMESLHAELARSQSRLEHELEPQLIAKVSKLMQAVAALDPQQDAHDGPGEEIEAVQLQDRHGAAGAGTDTAHATTGVDELLDGRNLQPQHTLFRFNSHQLAVRLPFLSLVLTNSGGFVNLERVSLHDDVSHALLHVEGLLGQSAPVHHMAQNGTKQDNDPHVQRDWHKQEQRHEQEQAQAGSRRAALLARMRDLSRAYSHHVADARYHISDYYVESQDLFGTDFVENRYSL